MNEKLEIKPHEMIVGQPLARQGALLRILIVDDNVESAKTLGWMIEALGYEPFIAYNGAEALELSRTAPPDAVLLDIGMPEMNGYELCQIMKQSHDLRNTVFIAQTGWDKKDNQEISKEAGFDHYLVKPVDIAELEKLLKKIVAERGVV